MTMNASQNIKLVSLLGLKLLVSGKIITVTTFDNNI